MRVEFAERHRAVPLFAYATSPSWHAVASDYAAVVEQKLADGDLREVVRDVLGPGEGKSPREIAELLLDFVTTRTRYTAVTFGNAKIVPQRPQDTLARQYGDCKDLATLYTGLLRRRVSRPTWLWSAQDPVWTCSPISRV